MNLYLIQWRYFHRKPRGAVSTGHNTIRATNEAAAAKAYKKIFGHHEIASVKLITGNESDLPRIQNHLTP